MKIGGHTWDEWSKKREKKRGNEGKIAEKRVKNAEKREKAENLVVENTKKRYDQSATMCDRNSVFLGNAKLLNVGNNSQEDFKEWYEERAAVREYEGGQDRADAERDALIETQQEFAERGYRELIGDRDIEAEMTAVRTMWEWSGEWTAAWQDEWDKIDTRKVGVYQ